MRFPFFYECVCYSILVYLASSLSIFSNIDAIPLM